jgi:hypothetical protein
LTGSRDLESWKQKEEGGEQKKSAHLRVCVLLQFPPERKWVLRTPSSFNAKEARIYAADIWAAPGKEMNAMALSERAMEEGLIN